MVLDNDAALQESVALYRRELARPAAQRAELTDWDEIEYPGRGGEDDERDDYIVDDRHGYRCSGGGAHWVEAATGPGGSSR